jgi:hypothetical protein
MGALAIMLGAMGLMALSVGDAPLATVCFVLAWVAILLPMRSPQVNACATILVCVYPALIVDLSVRLRHKREGLHHGLPNK